MLKKIIATLVKEWLLLKRDFAGLLVLLLMPAVLIIVMAMVQDAPFRDYQEIKFDLLIADEDQSTLSHEIIEGLGQSGHFSVIREDKGVALNSASLITLLKKGKTQVGIVIPKGAYAEIVNASNIIANSIAGRLGMPKVTVREKRDAHVRLYFDPATRPTFRTSISSALDKYVTYSCSKLLVERLSRLNGDDTDTTAAADFKTVFEGVGIREESLEDDKKEKFTINSVQHNVPAWAIFGMFFIVVPLASHAIREREEGSAMRIELIPGAQTGVGFGKVIFYMIVCLLQFYVMCAMGIWMMPLLGLPALQMGHHLITLFVLVAGIAFCATAYGYFLGAFFMTANQAMPFGAISVVILAALGGTWVPIELLPLSVQHVAMISPLRWGLSAVNVIMLRHGGFMDILPQLSFLTITGLLLLMLGIRRNQRRLQSL